MPPLVDVRKQLIAIKLVFAYAASDGSVKNSKGLPGLRQTTGGGRCEIAGTRYERNLVKTYGQAEDYFDVLMEENRPSYILVSGFQRFELYDLNEREDVLFKPANLPKIVDTGGHA